jgi:predicted transcriptional regulator
MNVEINLTKEVKEKKVFSIRLDADVKKKLDLLCKSYDMSQPEAITRMIEITYEQTFSKKKK